MKFGITAFVTDEGIRPERLAAAVEERGFDSLYLAEHSHIPEGSTAPDGSELGRIFYRSLDPFVALTAAAMTTSRILLGTGVALLAQRDAIHTAKTVSSLDHLSGGRAVLAVGAGWNIAELQNHGVDPATRGRLVDEQLTAIRRIWTEDVAEFDGEFVRFGRIFQWPKPVQRPHPPIIIGGHSKAARRRAIDHGDGWFPITVTPDDVRRFRDRLPEERRATFEISVPVTSTGPTATRSSTTQAPGARRSTSRPSPSARPSNAWTGWRRRSASGSHGGPEGAVGPG